MHKITSDLAQRRARQLWLKDLPINVDWDNLPEAEKRANLVLARKRLDIRLAALPKSSPERADIGAQMHVINTAINAIRPKLKGTRELAGYFIDVAMERLSKAQYKAFMDEASKRDRDSRELALEPTL